MPYTNPITSFFILIFEVEGVLYINRVYGWRNRKRILLILAPRQFWNSLFENSSLEP
jgi:hypothetical protein